MRGMSPFAFQVMMVVGSRRGTDGDAAEEAKPKMEAVVEDDDVDEEEDEEEEEEAPVFGRFGARVRNLFMAVLVRARVLCCVRADYSSGLALSESLEPSQIN